ncbi:related to DNF2 - Non-essential P-type ATPase [Melanopsichium pennsylvanicum]|uniref:P-type phospholipid transporter n=2 Tax=Melanopsichium pennsylvanicum TaxID=63383 RepID=A0AAJ4XQ03_9BASI|nr:phospholipid-translocating p-type atpase [Melanopsichium pennsylvanicum 4]SNX85013.1 related to DNF2 - Non-essential P-type ATPase [Melanopsichium pennsylvanicum]
MVFGGRFERHNAFDHAAHHYDPNNTLPYQAGPSDQSYITDPTHPDYDPMVDPNLQLKTVRTAAASIAESHRSEQRRDDRRKAKRANSLSHKLFRGRTLRKHHQKSTLAQLVTEEVKKCRSDPPSAYQLDSHTAFASAQQATVPDLATADGTPDDEKAQAQPESQSQPAGPTMRKIQPKKRRNVYVNVPPPRSEMRKDGDPNVTYPRNKVRTSKYTLVTFLPRFLFEQFRRVANIYFLGLVVLQVFPTFGATIPQIAMLPLVAILAITAIKDSIEDHRRHELDNEVNNSAVTRLGSWRNLNQAKDQRSWYQKLLGLSGRGSGKLSKGVRKLREKEDAIGLRQVNGNSRRAGGVNGGFRGTEEFGGRSNTRSVRSDSLVSSHALGTIMSESERDAASFYGASYNQSNAGFNRDQPNDYSDANASSVSMLQTLNQQQHQQHSATTVLTGGSNVEGVVDYRRHTPGTARWERTLWKKLEVGDIVMLREDEQVPADIVVLNTSDPDGNAYIETKNLDGETNLKVRKSLKATMGIQSEEDLEHARFVIDSEAPHANLYAYNGLLKYTVNEPSKEGDFNETLENLPPDSSAYAAAEARTRRVEPITINELLLRGCALRNTEWIIGVVLFTGEDTKIMLNSGETPSKRSKIEKETNFNVIVNFLILMALCTVCAVIGGLRLSDSNTSRAFYEVGAETSTSNIVNALIIFGSCLVVFQNIVPISLYISIEIVKTIQAFFIFQDIEMYYAPLDYPCVPKTWNISDDLGQIEYIFSDKTGTLTQNVMEFKKCSINGVSYGDGVTEAMIGAMKREGKDVSGFSAEKQEAELAESKKRMVDTMNRAFKNRYLQPDKMTLISPPMAETLAQSTSDPQRKNIITFFRALALCHTALADRPDGNDPYTVEYKAESPDEAALVAAARDAGAVFIAKNSNTVDIEVLGQPEQYMPLKVLEFNSTRKRMSTIVREPDGRILMITKGADSVIYQRLRADHSEDLKQSTFHDLEAFANAGLRTLCIAYRYLDEAEYMEWAHIHDEASAALTDRDEAIDEANEKIEVNLTLLGATALEDKLQVGVPEAIETLHKAGIKLWILTGDKLQTAIEIGFSCNLLTSDMEIMIISADHETGTRAQLEAACNKIAAAGRPVVVEEPATRKGGKTRKNKLTVARTEQAPKDGFAVVIDGETLRYALDANLRPLFLALTTQCEAVVCCRVSPAQKALTVKLVKDGKNAMTLAIGDGANDVAMIQEAHCGVGIAGLEGAQASMSADYAIGQFRFLTRLLLVHGQLCYHRISDLHKVFFYKNIIWTSILFFYQIDSDFDGSYIFDYTYVLLYNLVFCSLCVIVIGALDQVVNIKALLAFPQTYKRGIKGTEYTKSLFYMSMLDAAFQGAVCYFIPWWFFKYGPVVGQDGQEMGSLNMFGTTIAAGAVTTANLYAGIIAKHWTGIFWAVEIFSLLSVFVWTMVYSAFPVFSFQDVGFWLVQTVNFWAIILLITVVSLIPRFFARAWRSSFNPNEHDILREAWTRGDLKDQLAIPHHSEKRAHRAAAAAKHGKHNGDDSLIDSSYSKASDRDLEGQNSQLFFEAKQSTERERRRQHFQGLSAVGEEDDVSDTSADPLQAGGEHEDHYSCRNVGGGYGQSLQPSRTPQLQNSPGASYDRNNGAVSGLSFYDPDALPTNSDNAAPHTYYNNDYSASSDRTPRPDLPVIQVEHPPTFDRHENIAGFGSLAKQPSKDSFNMAFDEEFGAQFDTNSYPAATGNEYVSAGTRSVSNPTYDSSAATNVGTKSQPTTLTKSAVGRYHDRFKSASPSPTGVEQFDGSMVQSSSQQSLGVEAASARNHGDGDGHLHQLSGASGVSWHTAEASNEKGGYGHGRVATDASK